MVGWNKMLNFAIMKWLQVIFSKRCIWALLVWLGLFLPVCAHSVDSLYIKFQNCDNDLKIALANEIFSDFYESAFLDTLYAYNKHSKLAVVETNLHYWMAEYYFDKEQYAQSLAAISVADSLSRRLNDKQLRSDVLMTMYNAHYRLANYDKALKSLLEAYRIDLELGNKECISSDLNSLAVIYLAVQQPRLGIKYIEQAISIERKLKRADRLAMRLGIASELYLMNHETDKAMAAIDEAYKIDSQEGRAEKAAIRLSQKGAILEQESKLDEALTLLLKALPVLEKAENTYSLSVCYNQLASLNEKLGNRSAAIDYYKKALELSIKCGSPKTERVAEKGLWKTLRDENPAIAMIHLERYTTLTDSLYNRMASARVEMMDFTEGAISLEEENGAKQKNNKLLMWGGLLLLLLMALMLAAMTSAWRKSKTAMKMQRQTQELKSRFFTNITNELQAPLTVIMNAGERLLKNGKTNVEEGRRMGEMMVKHGNRMLALVNHLQEMEVVRSAIAPPSMRQGDIVMFVRMLVENFNDGAQSKMLHLEFMSPLRTLSVEFSTEYLRQIVHTLIAFAIRFTARGGYVNVSLDQHEKGQLKLCVADSGKGIPPDEMNSLFEPLSQGGENDGEGAGVSAGLAFVKQMVEAMNGTISVESHPGQGTTITIIFPAQVVKESADGNREDLVQFAESRLRQDSKQLPLAFIVENNEDVAFFIASHLRGHYHLRIARDGHEALKNAQDLVPDLIITNMVMPVMDGWELIRQVRSTPTLSHIPIIAMTSKLSEQERIACFEAGADNVLIRPIISEELKLVADHLVKQRSHLRDQLALSSKDSNSDAQSIEMSKDDRDFIRKLVEVIHAQMAKDDIDMEHIAAALSISRKQLRTRVMSITGLTPVTFVLQVRLNYARRIITTEDTPLTVIAGRCGFPNLSHFSKAFKQQFGVSPQQYRKGMDDIAMALPKSNS